MSHLNNLNNSFNSHLDYSNQINPIYQFAQSNQSNQFNQSYQNNPFNLFNQSYQINSFNPFNQSNQPSQLNESNQSSQVLSSSRYISESVKKQVLNRQNNRCANSPMRPALNLSNYQCLLWKCNDGYFDMAGCQFDHINEHCLTGDSSVSNIQALCPNCHSVKTKKFRKNKNLFTSSELNEGRECMDTSK